MKSGYQIRSNLANAMIHGEARVVKSFIQENPDEEVLFSCPATFSEFTRGSRRGISRRGIGVITSHRIFFKSVLFSLYSFVYLSSALVCLFVAFITGRIIYIIPGILVGMMISQRLPLERDILIGDVSEATIQNIEGSFFTFGNPIWNLRLLFDQKTIILTLQRELSARLKEKLEIQNTF